MAIVFKKIGPISAYAIAKEGGYTGTKEEFAVDIGNSAANAQAAHNAATSAANSALNAAASADRAMSGTPEGYAKLAFVTSGLSVGRHYVPSDIVIGYLNTSGEIAASTKRATFSEYIQIPYETQVALDDGYTGTICLYDENKGLDSRATFSSAAPYTVPAGTFFRVCIFKSVEEVISDASEYAKKCHLLIALPFGVQTLSASDDLNNVKQNGMYSVNGIGSNVPVPSDRSSALFGVLSVIASTNGNVYQIYTDYYQNRFVRRFSTSGWSNWVQYAKQSDLSAKQDALTFDTIPTANSTNPATSGGIKTYVDTVSKQPIELTGANDLNQVRTSGFYGCVTSPLPANWPVAAGQSSGLYGYVQVYALSDTAASIQCVEDYRNHFFIRRYSPSSGWTAWMQYAMNADIESASATKPLAAKIFKRVGCIGDSYTEGYINAGGQVVRANDYAWPHYMEALTGNTWTNFGVSGSSTKTWIDGGTYSKLTEVQASGNKCQAYVIGLMINDSNSSAHAYVPVGTAEDIGTDANSYYAYYYKLIQAIHSVNAQAPIFCNTCPQTASRFTAYNTALRNIVAYCKSQGLPVYLCDLASSKYNTAQYYAHPVFTTDFINGHYTGIGYEMMAECYLRVLSEVVLENVADFQTVHLIPYDTQ